jgi:hypothetical protein
MAKLQAWTQKPHKFFGKLKPAAAGKLPQSSLARRTETQLIGAKGLCGNMLPLRPGAIGCNNAKIFKTVFLCPPPTCWGAGQWQKQEHRRRRKNCHSRRQGAAQKHC